MSDDLKEPRETLEQWLKWLESLHPEEIDLGLERIKQVAERLNLITLGGDTGCNVVTVAGTNGKGSSIAALEAIYTDAGYRVGAYTSPHLLYYNERVRINGQPVSNEALIRAFEAVDALRYGISLTYFEFGTLAALYLFLHPEIVASKNPLPLDIVLLEVGLGGRLDAVNILDADIALITSVGIDHQAWLGESREEIGFEKAGIMRKGKQVVIGDSKPPASLIAHAEALNITPLAQGVHFGAKAKAEGQRWDWHGVDGSGKPVTINSLPQANLLLDNLASVLQVCQLLALPLKRENIEKGLSISLEGRQESVGHNPVHIFDVAHNAQAVSALAQYLELNPVSGKTYAILGMLADKKPDDILPSMQPHVDQWLITELPVNRSFSREALSQVMTCLQCDVSGSYVSPSEAYQSALSLAGEYDRIVIFGSFYTVSAVKQTMLKMRS
jgi:dihydrofolate synthase/folylpolyglutamate synthase